MEEATMTKGTKFGKTTNFNFIPYMGLFPVLRSKGRGSSISLPRKSKQHESGRCFHPSRTSNSPAQLPSK